MNIYDISANAVLLEQTQRDNIKGQNYPKCLIFEKKIFDQQCSNAVLQRRYVVFS